MIFILLPMLLLFIGLAAGSAYIYFKEEQARPQILIQQDYRTRSRE